MDNIEFSRTGDKAKRIKDSSEAAAALHELKTKAVRHIASIPEGRIFLNILMTECGYQLPSIVKNAQTGEIIHDAVIVNEAIRGLYLKIRSMIPKEKLRDIEFLDLREEAKNIVREDKGE